MCEHAHRVDYIYNKTHRSMVCFVMDLCSQRESNPHYSLRKAAFYPLNYGSGIIPSSNARYDTIAPIHMLWS
jgi:hypothetical protein